MLAFEASSSRMETFHSSYSYNKSSEGASVGRIIMTDSKIIYRNREYTSASAALLDYISEFRGKSGKNEKYVREVNDLLTPPSPLRMTADRSLSMGIRHTSQELHLHNIKTAIEDSYDKMKQVDEIIEVADVLNKSSDLLKKIDEDRLSDVNEVRSDIGSLATESLLDVNPYPVVVKSSSGSSQDITELRRGHIYSYRLPRPRSRTVTGVTFKTNSDVISSNSNEAPSGKSRFTSDPVSRESRSRLRPQSSDPSPGSRLRPGVPRTDTCTGTQRHRLRSRSESPNFHRTLLRDPFIDHPPVTWEGDLDSSVRSRNNVARLGLDQLEVMGNIRQPTKGGRTAPSWIEEIAGSDISSVATSELARPLVASSDMFTRARHGSSSSSRSSSHGNGERDQTADSSKPPELNFSDLVSERELYSERIKKKRPMGNVNTSTPVRHSTKLSSPAEKDMMRKDLIRLNNLKHVKGPSEPFRVSDRGTSSSNKNGRGPARDVVSRTRPVTATTAIDLQQKNGVYGELKSSSDKGRQKIDTMLEELDHLRSKLSNFSDETQSNITELSHLPGAHGNGTRDLPGMSNGLFVKYYQLCPSVDTDGLAEISSISKDPDHGARILSMGTDHRTAGSPPSPTLTDDLLNGDRPWEKLPPALKPTEDFISDRLQDGNQKSTVSGENQPRSMEALKNMLFRLQSEASDGISERKPGLQGGELSLENKENCLQPDGNKMMEELAHAGEGALADYNFEAEPGGQSLERALVHLSRLKSLVKNNEASRERREPSVNGAKLSDL